MAVDVMYFSTPTRKINERSEMLVTARFRERATNLDVTPSNCRYRLDSDGHVITDWTTLAPGPTATIQLTSSQTAILNDLRVLQPMTLSVATDYNLVSQYIDSLSFHVRNNRYSS